MASYWYNTHRYYHNKEISFQCIMVISQVPCILMLVLQHSIRVALTSNCSDGLNHAYCNYECVQEPTMHFVGFNGSSNIQHIRIYWYSTAVDQIHMLMNNYHDKTNMMSLEILMKCQASRSCNIQQGVSSYFLSTENLHYTNQSQHFPVNERVGQINSSYSANYSQCSSATP
jgi:hypothetical protein